jgi:hypothetical protein
MGAALCIGWTTLSFSHSLQTVRSRPWPSGPNAQKFFRHGVALKQVANFYNTMDQELIQSHLAILLEPAKQFEAVVNANKKKGVTWSKTDEAEKYISKLTLASQQLTGSPLLTGSMHTSLSTGIGAHRWRTPSRHKRW